MGFKACTDVHLRGRRERPDARENVTDGMTWRRACEAGTPDRRAGATQDRIAEATTNERARSESDKRASIRWPGARHGCRAEGQRPSTKYDCYCACGFIVLLLRTLFTADANAFFCCCECSSLRVRFHERAFVFFSFLSDFFSGYHLDFECTH